MDQLENTTQDESALVDQKAFSSAMELADLYEAHYKDQAALCSREPNSTDIWSAFMKGYMASSRAEGQLSADNTELMNIIRQVAINSVEAKTSGFWERLCNLLEKRQS